MVKKKKIKKDTTISPVPYDNFMSKVNISDESHFCMPTGEYYGISRRKLGKSVLADQGRKGAWEDGALISSIGIHPTTVHNKFITHILQ